MTSTSSTSGIERELVNAGVGIARVLVVYGSPEVDRPFAAAEEAVTI